MHYAKAVVGAIGLVVTALTAILADDIVDATEAGTLVTVLIEVAVATWAIWRVPNGHWGQRKPETSHRIG